MPKNTDVNMKVYELKYEGHGAIVEAYNYDTVMEEVRSAALMAAFEVNRTKKRKKVNCLRGERKRFSWSDLNVFLVVICTRPDVLFWRSSEIGCLLRFTKIRVKTDLFPGYVWVIQQTSSQYYSHHDIYFFGIIP